MTRFLVVFLTLAVPGFARAQVMDQTGQGTASALVAADFLIALRTFEEGEWVPMSDFDRERFFNKARCACKIPVQVTVGFTTTGVAKKSSITRGNVQLVLGNEECVGPVDVRKSASCIDLGSPIDLVSLSRTGRVDQETTVDAFFGNFATGCDGTRRSENVRLLVDADQNDTPDLMGASAPNLPIELDSEPPPQPMGIRATAGNEALEVSWEALEGQQDFLGHVVLCSRGENHVVFSPSPYDDQYQTVATVCPEQLVVSTQPQVLATDEIPPEGMGPYAPPQHFIDVAPAYLCSDLLTTQNSARLAILQNDIPYLVGVASVDKHFNASPIDSVFLQKPIATRDFYRGYREAGGESDGGFCSVAVSRNPRGPLRPLVPLVALALLWAGHRRSSGRRRFRG